MRISTKGVVEQLFGTCLTSLGIRVSLITILQSEDTTHDANCSLQALQGKSSALLIFYSSCARDVGVVKVMFVNKPAADLCWC